MNEFKEDFLDVDPITLSTHPPGRGYWMTHNHRRPQRSSHPFPLPLPRHAQQQGFDSSGPIGALTPVAVAEGGPVSASAGLLGDEGARKIWLEVDGTKRQDSVLGEMVWSVPEMIARLSEVRQRRGKSFLLSAPAPAPGGLDVFKWCEASPFFLRSLSSHLYRLCTFLCLHSLL